MKKNLSLFAGILLISTSAFSQLVTISQENQLPVIGDTISYKNLNLFGFDPAGEGDVTDMTWDYSSLSETGSGVTYWWVDASTTDQASEFPEANLALADDQTDGHFYYKYETGSDTIYRTGTYGEDGGTIMQMNYDYPYIAEFTFPVSAGDTYGTTYEGDMGSMGAGEDSTTIEDGEYAVNPDAQGTLILPNGTVLDNVLRLHVIESFDIKLYIYGKAITYTISDDAYYWYHDTITKPVFQYIYTEQSDGEGGTDEYESLRYQDIGGEVGNQDIVTAKMEIFPNPTTGIVNTNNIDEISIYNAIGQEVYHNATLNSKETINLEHLEKGIYIMQAKNANGTRSEKLIIE
ncbi:MAG: T9SS type A sorting domain-containing protein [Bacteroidales bacterium]